MLNSTNNNIIHDKPYQKNVLVYINLFTRLISLRNVFLPYICLDLFVLIQEAIK